MATTEPKADVVDGGTVTDVGTAAPADDPIYLHFTGDGSAFFHGVPTRDLTKREADEIRARRPEVYAVMMTPSDRDSQALYERVKGGK